MKKENKKLFAVFTLLCAMLGVCVPAKAMHIMEGYMSPVFCITWGIICLPFLAAGFLLIRKRLKENRKNITLLAMSGAFIFVISSLKIPSVTGSCSHMTGTGLGAILFGPLEVSLLGIIVLLFQSLLLAHGGITTLGANTFSMAIAGPLVSYAIYKLFTKMKVNRKVTVFLAAFLGDLFTYGITSMQLAIDYPSAEGGIPASAIKFLGVFAPTQLPLAVVEGVLTVLIVMALEHYALPELKNIGYMEEEGYEK